jgi:NAD(P)-dependent dehydrogenase (short-subunit alcohol dehydrogenase family)
MKNILITGAAGNLGKIVTAKFLTAGYRVVAIVSPQTSLSSLPKDIAGYHADLSDEASANEIVNKIIQEHGTIDAALLLAGGFAMGNILHTHLSHSDDMIALNFNTAYNIARPLFTQMSTQPNGGRIILIGARPALEHRGGKDMIAYALSKSLIFKLAELLNAEGKDKNITASVIVPGTIDTPANREAMPKADRSTWVTSEELAEAMLYLISDNSRALRETVLKFYGNA